MLLTSARERETVYCVGVRENVEFFASDHFPGGEMTKRVSRGS